MLDFLTAPFLNGPQISPIELSIRLLTALFFGWIISVVYLKTRKNPDLSPSFPATLVLLCVLIAMVTQVIGDNVARAFSLVGALSIVRFRTVVRDTQDTAYVILAVIVGMAVGSKALWVAAIGICVVGLAEYLINYRRFKQIVPGPEYTLRLKTLSNMNLEDLVSNVIGKHLEMSELISLGTGKRGALLEAAYRLRLQDNTSAHTLINLLVQIDGVESVQLLRRGLDED
jgi:hypothetical protein